ncbi:MAG: type II secretion system protein [Proteobacteria bacterium]|nr:type II secretion system protein [Pseudomonadota bacterium]
MKAVPQSGFTILELLVVTVTLAALTYLSMNSFVLYRAQAAYSVAAAVLHNAHTAVEASATDPSNAPGALSIAQSAPGRISDPAARAYLPQLILPMQVKLTASYDPNCTSAGCMSDFLEVKHCLGKEYLQWMRFGDGIEVMLPHIAGDGC